MEKEFVKGLFRNIALALIVIGGFLFLLAAGSGFPLLSIVIDELGWRIAIAVLGFLLIASGLFIWSQERRAKEKPTTDSQQYEFYMQRKDIHWKPFNDRVSYRYWVCGTSLVGAIERKLAQRYLQAGIRDIKVILPKTQPQYSSYAQLESFSRFGDVLIDQVSLAKSSFVKLESQMEPYVGELEAYLKKYGGVMYSNITIFDDDAFIAFYDCAGMGDSNFTLHFNREVNEEGYRFVENEFQRMWDASGDFGIKLKKKKGASIIFIDDSEEVLLFLRDDDESIPYPNLWDVLGGHVERGETPKECIVREMQEEIAIGIKKPNLFNVYDMEDRLEYTYWQRADFDIDKILLSEGQHLRWFSKSEIENMTDDDIAFGFRSVLLDFFEQSPFRGG